MRAFDLKIKPERSRKIDGGPAPRPGFTLTELLVVSAIIVILIGLAVPMARPALEERQVREGARQLTTALSRARIKASELQRPCGVRLERYADHPTSNNTCLLLRPLESPPPYSGMQPAVRVMVASSSNNSPTYDFAFALADPNANAADGDLEAKAFAMLIGKGDEIQFNHQGPRYTVMNGDPNSPFASNGDAVSGVELNREIVLPGSSLTRWPLAFTVYRRPIPSLGQPTIMPSGSVIDLEYSGIGQSGIQFGAANGPIDILFSPHGEVESVYYGTIEQKLVEPIFFMLGRYDRTYGQDPDLYATPAGVLPEDARMNYEDFNNLWIVLIPRTGLAAGGDVFPQDEPRDRATPGSPDRAIVQGNVSISRTDAANVQQSLGGR